MSYWTDLKSKKDKTTQEQILLLFRNSLSSIDEVIIDYKKQEFSSDYAISLIEEILKNINNGL